MILKEKITVLENKTVALAVSGKLKILEIYSCNSNTEWFEAFMCLKEQPVLLKKMLAFPSFQLPFPQNYQP